MPMHESSCIEDPSFFRSLSSLSSVSVIVPWLFSTFIPWSSSWFMRAVSAASDLFDFSLHFISFLIISLITLLILVPDTFNFHDVVDEYPAHFRWGHWHPVRERASHINNLWSAPNTGYGSPCSTCTVTVEISLMNVLIMPLHLGHWDLTLATTLSPTGFVITWTLPCVLMAVTTSARSWSDCSTLEQMQRCYLKIAVSLDSTPHTSFSSVHNARAEQCVAQNIGSSVCTSSSPHLHGHPRCAVVRSLTFCSSPCSFPCVSPIPSSSTWTQTCTSSSMWLTSGQLTTGTPPTEESGPLAEFTPLTGYEPKLPDDFHTQRPLKSSSRTFPAKIQELQNELNCMNSSRGF